MDPGFGVRPRSHSALQARSVLTRGRNCVRSIPMCWGNLDLAHQLLAGGARDLARALKSTTNLRTTGHSRLLLRRTEHAGVSAPTAR